MEEAEKGAPRPCQLMLGYFPSKTLSELGGAGFIYNILKRQKVIKIDEVTVLSPADSISKKVGTLIGEFTEIN